MAIGSGAQAGKQAGGFGGTLTDIFRDTGPAGGVQASGGDFDLGPPSASVSADPDATSDSGFFSGLNNKLKTFFNDPDVQDFAVGLMGQQLAQPGGGGGYGSRLSAGGAFGTGGITVNKGELLPSPLGAVGQTFGTSVPLAIPRALGLNAFDLKNLGEIREGEFGALGALNRQEAMLQLANLTQAFQLRTADQTGAAIPPLPGVGLRI